MYLGLEECIEIILCGYDGLTQRQVTSEFNNHWRRNPVIQSTYRKLLKKLKETGSMIDIPHSEHPSNLVSKTVIAKCLKKSARHTSL